MVIMMPVMTRRQVLIVLHWAARPGRDRDSDELGAPARGGLPAGLLPV